MYLRFLIYAVISVFPFISLMPFSTADASLSVTEFGDSPALQTVETPIDTESHELTARGTESDADVSEAEGEEIPTEDESLTLTPTEIENTLPVDGVSDEALSSLLGEATGQETGVESPSAMPDLKVTYDMPVVPANEHVKKYISLFQNRLRPNFETWLSRSGRYVDMIQKTLRENNLPQDLVYLALIESGFSPKAHSRSKASGVWQFMEGTGKRYGLRIDRWIDERRDPVKATQAAVRYLTELYNMFGSWPLALAGYNAGEGRVYQTIVRVRTRDFWTLRESSHLHPETRNYVPKFMAATIIAKDPGRYGFLVEYEAPWIYDEVEIQDATYLNKIARYAGISVKELKEYNPELKHDVTPPRAPGYKIKLPPGKKEIFLAAYSPEMEEKVFVGRSVKHRVRKGETLSSIAQQYGVNVESLIEVNRLGSSGIIHAGQYVWVNESVATSIDGTHKIERGETISTIASKYNLTIPQLLEANQLDKKSVIRAGRTLTIPSNASTPKNESSTRAVEDQKKHQIRTGESISTIAQKYAVRIKDLLNVNQLTKSSVIHAGHTLIIP